MKKKFTFLPVFLCVSILILAQNGGRGFDFKNTECLSDEQRTAILQILEESRTQLKKEGKLPEADKTTHPLFIWPVENAPGAPYFANWSISNHVDHNPAYPNQVQDWNCGTRTYDTEGGYNHQGIDIFTWPFGWYQMDESHAYIVAAAPGTILYKSNGNYDRRCAFNNSNWNAVYLQHADGSVTWYGHMKNNSLTAKVVGETVAAGEYLGIVGSSGNSTGPHLHFEVYNPESALVDTYAGPCNTWESSTDSWWQQQKPYVDPKINAILTHSAPVVLDNGCGVQETTNIKNDFVTGNFVYPTIYLSDIPAGTSMNVKLYRPDNSVAYNYNFTMNTFYAASYWYWEFGPSVFNQNGTWKFTLTAGSLTKTHTFTFNAHLATNENSIQQNISILNPVKNNKLLIYSGLTKNTSSKIEIFNAEGRLLQNKKVELNTGNTVVDFPYEKGNYLIRITTNDGSKSFKIINQ